MDETTTMRERRAAGKIFTEERDMTKESLRGKRLAWRFNRIKPGEFKKGIRILRKLFGSMGRHSWVEPPLNVCYGSNVHIGYGFYANMNLTLVDDWEIRIGNDVMIAPNVTIAVTGHPIHHERRDHGEMYAFPVTIGDHVWICAGAIVLPGVTIGERSVIGAGSVVTRDIPAGVLAAGNPCRVIRPITDRDREFYYRELRFDDVPV
jgi:galactoside O-acetyltransferase